jgi:ankyrin repeat protein
MKEDSQIVSFTPRNWHHHFWQQNKIFANHNKFNAINPSLFNKLSATNQTPPTLNYKPLNTAFNILLSKIGSKYNLCADKARYVLRLLQPCGTLLMCSIMDNYHLTAKILLFLGTDPNKKLFTFTPLETAILAKQDEMAKLLIKNGANLNTISKECGTPLQLAITMERHAIAELLIKNGANLESCDADQNTPLHLAAKKGNYAVVELLVNCNANLHAQNKDLQTPLHLALKMRCHAIAELLIKNGANLKLCDADQNTPLHLAVQKNNDELATLMIQKGAVIDAKDIHGYPALYYAITSRFGSDKSVKLLLEHGADANFCDKNGDNLILLAAKKANWDALKVLIEDVKLLNSININACDSQGRTALYYAISFHKTMLPSMRSCTYITNEASIKLLLEHGADTNCCNHNNCDTPLLLAAQKNNWEAVKLLVDKSENINARDSKGNTALHYAASNGQEDVIPLLIQNGADLTIKDNKGITPMQIAIKKQDFKTALLIYEKYIELPSNQHTLNADLVLQETQQFITILEDHPISVMLKTLYSYKPKNIKSAATNRPNNSDHPGGNPEKPNEVNEELAASSSQSEQTILSSIANLRGNLPSPSFNIGTPPLALDPQNDDTILGNQDESSVHESD